MDQATLTFQTSEQLAIIAAQGGDWGPADQMELEFLNDPKNLIYPHEAGFPYWGDYDEDNDVDHARGALVAKRLIRSDEGLLVEWETEAGIESLTTDIDGVIVDDEEN